MKKKNKIKKKEINIEFVTIGEIDRDDLKKFKAGDGGPGTNAVNTCTVTDKRTRSEKTCIPTI